MRSRIILAFILLLSIAILISGCSPAPETDIKMEEVSPTGNNIETLPSVEVREYNGQKLDSTDAFRENSIHGPQEINISNYKLEVSGLVETPLNLAYDKVLESKRYEKIVTLYCVEGWDAKVLWTGVLVKDIIAAAKPKPEANTIIFYAYDGYSTSFPLDYVTDNDILIAYMINKKILQPDNGYPFQLVAENKWGYKWIKWITKIELSDNPDYKGYWESRGYNQNGSLEGQKFE